MTDEGAVSVDTLIKDVIITPMDRTSWAKSLKSPHITSLQLADDFSQTQFPVQILALTVLVPMIPKQLHSVLQQVTPLTVSHLMTVNGFVTLVQRILRCTTKLQISSKLKH